MFADMGKLTELDVSGVDTSNVTDMAGMFNECSELTSLDVSGFDTSNVENMAGMFAGCKKTAETGCQPI
jgi:surface protein